jgi:eukaryotic-like serine/threonine-protein kinase
MALVREGQIIRGTYEVERFLGEGAFAEVYRVKHRFLGRQAMKVLKIIGMTIDEVEQYLEEAIILSRVGHPNIVRVFDANITETSKGICGFFTMEYVAGGSLEQFWRSYGAQFVPVETAVEIMRQVCRGIAVAHREKPPIIHRDIKPQNILVGYDAEGLRARASDFGLAKRVNPLTLMASARGTRCFKPPEVFLDYQSDSCAGDVWALGSTLYLLLTDRLPFSELGEMDVFDGKSFGRPMIPASRLNIQVDPALDQILFKALALKPEDRYPSASAFLEDLSNWKPLAPGRSAQPPKQRVASDMSKSALGSHSPANQTIADKMAAQATKLAREAGKLQEAADMMEEAFNKWPDLRRRHECQVKVWRRGISM